MAARERTAVVAETSAEERARLSGLLRELGYAAPLEAEDGLAALRLVEDRLPDALLISATLRPGDGVWLAQEILKRSGLFLPGRDRLTAEGAAFIERPVRRDALASALDKTDVVNRRLSEAFCQRRDELLDRLGVVGHEGRAYLQTAVGYAWMDARLARQLTTALYPLVGRRHGVSARKVEQSMRYAIELAWKRGRIDEQYTIFRGTIDAQRGKPTCGEMIAQLADILRMEEV